MAVGNNPLGFGVPVAGAADLVADMCWAYASWSSFEALAVEGREIPAHWATDSTGQPTTDPAAGLRGGPEPIGGHKGVAMAMLVEVLASVLSDGAVADEIIRDGSLSGLHSQVALVIDPGATVGVERVAARTSELLQRTAELVPARTPFRYSGERSSAARAAAISSGVAVAPTVVEVLDEWAVRLKIAPLART
jgi:LDH2 family malate/lactate/ureidoglycolate dehydrogenase